MTNVDKDKFVNWMQKRRAGLLNQLDRDMGGGLTDRLGRYNEINMIINAILRGEFDEKIWKDD